MYNIFLDEIQGRKESTQTEIPKYTNQENECEQEFQNQPLPQLKNLMSYQSEVNGDGLQRVLSSCQMFSLQPDVPNVSLPKAEQIILQAEYSEKTECSEAIIQKNEGRAKRKRLAICYNDDSNDQSQLDGEMNQPCKCSKSHCLQLYCSCFHRNIECTELCKCYDCHNTHDHSDIRNKALDRIKIKSQRQQHDEDLFDRQSVWGCKCKKSQCKKNYCECYIRNKKCSSHCKCSECENKKKTPKGFKKVKI